MKRRGRRPQAVIGVKDDGEVRRWKDMREAAAELGTTVGTLRVYMCLDMSYKGYSLDYEPERQMRLF